MPGARANAPSAAELLGVRQKPKNARDRLVAGAIELFYIHGFNAVGLDRIIAAAGVTKTTFYKHFASKDDLVVEAVKRRDEWEAKAWGRAVRELGGDDPRAQLLAHFDVLDIWFNDPDFRGCIFQRATQEFPNPHDPVHAAGAAHLRRNRDAWAKLAAKAGAHDPDAFADQFALLMEGTLVMRQSHGRNDAARVAKAAAAKLLAEHLPAAGERRG